jgi:hypothetical protein
MLIGGKVDRLSLNPLTGDGLDNPSAFCAFGMLDGEGSGGFLYLASSARLLLQ